MSKGKRGFGTFAGTIVARGCLSSAVVAAADCVAAVGSRQSSGIEDWRRQLAFLVETESLVEVAKGAKE